MNKITERKAKFKRTYIDPILKEKILIYEYKGHQYGLNETVSRRSSYSLSQQHEDEQNRIDRILKVNEFRKNNPMEKAQKALDSFYDLLK